MARYALVIGIAEYVSPSLPRLSKTTNDAEAIAQLLEQYGDFQSVQRLPQRWNKDKNGYEMAAQKVTGAQLGQELRTFLLEKAVKSEALIYFSGHGFITSDNLGQKKGYLATYDCQVETEGNQIVAQKNGISLDSLNKLIADSQLSSLVVLLDCCNSGYFLEAELVEQTLTAFRPTKDYYLIAACRSFERAGVIKSEEYSIFTGAVLKGLAVKNAGNSRRISSDGLFDFVSNELKGSEQEPIRMGWGRSINLVTYSQLDIATGEKIAFNQENPYLGLSAFKSEQEKYFFGRDEAVRTLISRLAKSRFLAVIGYSGSGKSSLVKAGVIPQLKRNCLPGSSEWAIADFTPGNHPRSKLLNILAQQHENQPYVLFIDQFEEVFTLCQDEEERKAFIHLVVQEVKADEKQTRIILTIRGDFLNKCAEYLEIITLINSYPPTAFIMTPMSFSELEEAIEKPTNLHGVTFERGLVSQIAQDIFGQPGALPLLQYALKELWQVCIKEPKPPEPLLTRIGYRKIGGVIGALDKRATSLYQNFSPEIQEFVRKLFIEELVEFNKSGEVTRQRVSWERLKAKGDADFQHQLQRVIGFLADSEECLIITDQKTIEIAHEALLTEWKLLNNWIIEGKENIRLNNSLKEDCQEWEERFKKSDDALLTGAKLAVISEWVERTEPTLTLQEAEFLHKSLQKREQKLEDLKRKNKQLKQRALALGFSLVAAIGASFLALFQANHANQEYQLSEARRLQGLAESNLDTDPMSSLLLSLEIAGRGFRTEASSVLWKSLINIKEESLLAGHQENITKVTFSKNGRYILTVSQDTTARVWDLKTPGKFQVLSKHQSALLSGSFSSDNQKILTIGNKEKAFIWDINNLNHPPIELPVPPDKLHYGNFSEDGKKVITVGHDGMAIVWNLDQSSGKFINHINLQKHSGTIWYGAFSPLDSNKILTVSENGEVRFINLNNPQVQRFFKHDGAVNYGIFNFQKDNLILTASKDKTARVWDLNQLGDQEIIKLRHKDIVYQANFHPQNSQIILSSGKEETAYLWDTRQANKPLISLSGHSEQIRNSIFAPTNYNRILTTSFDGTARVWELAYSNSSIKVKNVIVLKGHKLKVMSGTFNPINDNIVVTGEQDNLARIWNIKSSINPIVLTGHTKQINYVSWNSQSLNRILTVSADNTARVWELQKPENPKILKGHKQDIITGTFSPYNQNLVLTASVDKTARLWNIQAEKPELISEMPHQARLTTASFSPNNGQNILTASYDGYAKIWTLEPSGKVNQQPIILNHDGYIDYAAFSPSGNLVLTLSSEKKNKTVKIWQYAKSNNPIAVFQEDTNYAEFNPKDENQFLTAGYDGIAKIWNITTKKVVKFQPHKGAVLRATFSQNAKQILTVSEDGTARVWNSPNNYIELVGHKDVVGYGMFHPKDYNLVITASEDGTARLWNLKDYKHPIVLSGHNKPVVMSIFNPASNIIQIATVSKDNTAVIYTLNDWNTLIDDAWKKATRCMSEADKKINSIDAATQVPITSLQLGFPRQKFSITRPFCN